MSSRVDFLLASASPRRRELLEAGGWRVEVRIAGVTESPLPGEDPTALVLRLAQAKAAAVAASFPGGRPEAGLIVLGADTEVAVTGEVLGQPADAEAAAGMLRRLAGRDHVVHTGVCLIGANGSRSAVASTRVWLNPLDEAAIAAYVATGEPFGKAGGYAIQGKAARFIPRIEGSYSNVVGLPLELVARLARELTQP